MNRTVKNILILIIVLVLLFLFFMPKIEFGNSEGAEQSESGPAISAYNSALPVNAVVLKPQSMENKIRVTGTVQANESVDLKSELNGIVEKIYFQEGQRVRKGDLLLSLNDEESRAQLEKLTFSKKLYEDNEYRQKILLEREAISREEYEIALTELRTSEADIKLLEVQINKAQIRAPFDGVVGLRNISEGSYVTPATSIVNIYSIDPAKIEFSIPARYSGLLGIGDKIYFELDGTIDQYEGSIYALEPLIDPATRTLRLRATAPNKNSKILPGQFARIEVVLEELDSAILVPSIAVTPTADAQIVFVAKNGVAEQRTIEIGMRTESEIQVARGLNIGDTVITSGILQLRPGIAIEITNLKN